MNKLSTREIDSIKIKLGDWRGDRLTQVRNLIKQADPNVIEEVKWKKASNPDGIPVWSHDGIICTGEYYKNHLRLTFPKAEHIKDYKGLFNSYRAIVIHESHKVNEAAFKNLILEAVELNRIDKNKSKS